jgi:hypothetical protein
MAVDVPDEVLFTVVGETATLAKPVRIEDLGLTEPAHLERWIIQHPETLGEGTMIVASQYDRWVTPGGTETKDRLDLLGLDDHGRLVVGELKRGRAPDTVELQAVKYAAMTSRFTLDKLADLHARFLERTSEEKLTSEEAEDKLQAHLAPDVEISLELFASPRIVLLAESYAETTVTSVVWLAEQGVDITLRRYKAYMTDGGETIVSVSQIYPLADVGNWLMGPGRGPKDQKRPEHLPEVAWSVDDFRKLLDLNLVVPIAAMSVCAENPGSWIPSTTVFERAGVEPPSGRGQVAGFGYSVRTTFRRCNPPWEAQWHAGEDYVSYYRLDAETSEHWHEAMAATSPEGVAPPALGDSAGPT